MPRSAQVVSSLGSIRTQAVLRVSSLPRSSLREQACKLVHGDLSEYNVLYLRGKLQVIDVSQSVEHDHPQALESAA